VSIHNQHGGRLVGEVSVASGHRRVGIVTISEAVYAEKEVAGFPFGLGGAWADDPGGVGTLPARWLDAAD